MELLSYLPTAIIVALSVIGGASVALKGIAPLTKTERDDKLLTILRKVEGWLTTLALNTKAKP